MMKDAVDAIRLDSRRFDGRVGPNRAPKWRVLTRLISTPCRVSAGSLESLQIAAERRTKNAKPSALASCDVRLRNRFLHGLQRVGSLKAGLLSKRRPPTASQQVAIYCNSSAKFSLLAIFERDSPKKRVDCGRRLAFCCVIALL